MHRIAYHPGTGTNIVTSVIHELECKPICITEKSQAQTTKYDAVLLLGGADIAPFLYGQPKTYSNGPDRNRDIVEWIMVKRAITENMPTMGICRGHQMIAVAHGGILYQDILAETGITHGKRNGHSLTNISKTLRPYLPHTVGVLVNSLHHQAVRIAPSGFDIVAEAPDGIIESIWKPGTLGVQWHPELMVTNDLEWMRLFQWFCLDGLS